VRARYFCPVCLTSRDHAAGDGGEFACVKCGRAYAASLPEAPGASGVERCAFCGNRAFFLQKDFDQRLGCLFLALSLAGALLVGWKLGWIWFTPVLLATVLIDWIVATRVRPVTICYRCNAEYRDVAPNPRHRGYDPHVAERYAEKKTVRRMR
jgi:DNA-directed RNA polymerase subunit RPC12/RpoP